MYHMNSIKFIAFTLLLLTFNGLFAQESIQELDKKVALTKVNTLPYNVNDIVVRGFDGTNPPPRLETPMRNMFYGYGMTAYIQSLDTLIFFNIVRLDAKHENTAGKVLRESEETGNRYTEAFKNYFTAAIEASEWKNIYFDNIYLVDKKGNYLKISKRMKFCPHCK